MLDNITVKVPKNEKADYDYIAFSFNGYHSFEDLRLIRTSDSNRYNENLGPEQAEKIATVQGVDGVYFFGTRHKKKVFNIKVAFEKMSESTLRLIKKVFDGRDVHPLWFAEAPYKVYEAKVTGQPVFKVIPFDGEDGTRYYNGEGTIQFTAFYPYARTPDSLVDQEGKTADWGTFGNYAQWIEASGLANEQKNWLNNVGQLPAPFTYTKGGITKQSTRFDIGENFVITKEDCEDLIWDSKTGMITGIVKGVRRPINCTGKLMGAIPVGGIPIGNLPLNEENGDSFVCYYWYY